MNKSIVVKDLDLAFGPVEVLKKLNIEIYEGEFLVLLGPSGCGKSTLLNCLAGLLDITGGQIFINDKNVTWAEPKDRGIGMVFQSYALYPQMTVQGNLEFGLKNQKMAKDEIAKRVAYAADILQIGPLLDRKPAALSGGQRQRVAIGRALVREANVFLFDEPLSNLDAKLRSELRVELKRLHARLGNTMVYVTHDQIEALTLADRIAIMRGGIIQQLDDPLIIYNKPTNLFVAGFIGSPSMNFMQGEIFDNGKRFKFGNTIVSLDGYDAEGKVTDGKAILGVRPEYTTVLTAAGTDSVSAKVDLNEPMGSESLLWMTVEGEPFCVKVKAEDIVANGSDVHLDFNIAKASLFDAETEMRL
ncbi:MAG: ATP-binding cassette domain-containing protein [Alphaproteobacteria bacterium]|nr:ATP-binding cassette domain-containing protein [Alphaproteobacteria bacterium]